MRHPDKISSRTLKMQRAIRQLEAARKNMEAAYRPGQLALDIAMHNADGVLALMRNAVADAERGAK